MSARPSLSDHDLPPALASTLVTLRKFSTVLSALCNGDPAPPIDDLVADEDGPLWVLSSTFDVGTFGSLVLLLAAGNLLDPDLARSCDQLAGGVTFRLVTLLTGSLDAAAIAPDGPLRRFRLIDLAPGPSLLDAPIALSEWSQHVLFGNDVVDPRLSPYLEPLDEVPPGTPLPPLTDAIRHAAPCVTIVGDTDAARAAVAVAAYSVGRPVYELRTTSTSLSPNSYPDVAALVSRELRFRDAVLFVPFPVSDPAVADRLSALCSLIDDPVVLASPEPVSLGTPPSRPHAQFTLPAPTAADRDAAWSRALTAAGLTPDARFDAVRSWFQLTPPQLDAFGPQLASALARDPSADPVSLAWDCCRALCRTTTDGLAERLDTHATWSDLVLPPASLVLLQTLCAQVRHRATVYDRWGMAGTSGRGLGIAAVFAGPSGTGKTTAAEAIADTLHLDLLRVDLSAVTSKYIGETEKNLARVFDAAENSGAVLLFDEADALFGKRSEVRDARDRYANLEVSYLLQRMESYRGLSILTTNLKEAIDKAFLRRFRFVVDFPFPGVPERVAMWQRVFPPTVPTEGLDPTRLARFAVPGGVIRNVALHAAFLAANEGTPVRMGHLRRAAQTECTKLERSLADNEIRGWE